MEKILYLLKGMELQSLCHYQIGFFKNYLNILSAVKDLFCLLALRFIAISSSGSGLQ